MHFFDFLARRYDDEKFTLTELVLEYFNRGRYSKAGKPKKCAVMFFAYSLKL